jgi:hypothetical protein
MNRHERRKKKSGARMKKMAIAMRDVDSTFDIQVDAKVEQIVMIFANVQGRKVVADLWPDVQWTTDETFSSVHSPDWLFTHIRVTKLPPHLEGTVPLAFASSDALGFAVAMALQRVADPRRVVHWTGQGRDIRMNVYDPSGSERDIARSLFAEYVPVGTLVGAPESVN